MTQAICDTVRAIEDPQTELGERTNLLVNLVEAVTAHTSTAAARKRPKRQSTQPALSLVTFGSFAAMEQAHQLNFLVNDMLANQRCKIFKRANKNPAPSAYKETKERRDAPAPMQLQLGLTPPIFEIMSILSALTTSTAASKNSFYPSPAPPTTKKRKPNTALAVRLNSSQKTKVNNNKKASGVVKYIAHKDATRRLAREWSKDASDPSTVGI
ncbi:unnamed protein product [Cylindrotheca closterium]|uniref:Uncharacterized protein n=1 Tax=Cylindrotheca closterium TaxID=2856 RepID=A0AAD2CPU5_9STRA|nr:unnamed protein product [Cylindrotheca closterium]